MTPCGFVPPTPGYAGCTREKGHDGPCAHPFAIPSERQFITDWYGRLCAQARQDLLAEPNMLCTNCGQTKQSHLHTDSRCNLFATSTTYLAINRRESQMLVNTIAAVEALANIRGWSLVPA